MNIFDILPFLFVPPIIFLLKQVELFAPKSPWRGDDRLPRPKTDLLFATNFIEVYANYKLAVAVVLIASTLAVLTIVYCFVVGRQRPGQERPLPWQGEWSLVEESGIGLVEGARLGQTTKFFVVVIDPPSRTRPESRQPVPGSTVSTEDIWSGIISHYLRPDTLATQVALEPLSPIRQGGALASSKKDRDLQSIPSITSQQIPQNRYGRRSSRSQDSGESSGSEWASVYYEEGGRQSYWSDLSHGVYPRRI